MAALDALSGDVSPQAVLLRRLAAAVLPLAEERRIKEFLAGQAGRLAAAREMTIEVICSETLDPAMLTRPELYLDEATLDDHYEETRCRLGVVSENRTHEYVEKVTFLFVKRLARRFAESLSLSADLLVDVWYEHLFCEFSQMLAARHLARRLARMAAGQPVLIPLDSLTWHYRLGFENDHSLEPFYLLNMLQRFGVTAAFICRDPELVEQARTEGGLSLTFAPDKAAWGLPLPTLPDPEVKPSPAGRQVLVAAGIRGFGQILPWLDDPIRIQSDAMMNPNFPTHRTALDPAAPPLALKLRFVRRDGGAAGPILLSTTLPHNDLGRHFVSAVGPATQAAVRRARDLVAQHNVTEAHICDDVFFAPSIYLHAVREAGGKVYFWPHSCNAGWPFLRRPGTVDVISCAYEGAAAEWRAQLPDADVRIVSQLCLPRFRGFPEANPDEPLSLIIIDNAFRSGRLAMLDCSDYDDTYRLLLAGLGEMTTNVRYLVKPRNSAALHRISRMARRSPAFGYIVDPPLLVDRPNMVFLFPTQLSSAMLEGMARGIPALAVKQHPGMRQYIAAPSCVPVGSIEFVLEEVGRLCDPGYRLAMAKAQHEWFKTQTDYPEQFVKA